MTLERLVQDLRFAWRMLRRSPGFTAVALCTLALGVGATTAMFTVVNAVILRPLPFSRSDRLVMVWETPPGHTRPNVVQTQNYLDWRARNRSFDGLAAMLMLPMTVSGRGDAQQVNGLAVTGDFFRVLGVAPMLGRAIRPGEDIVGAAGVVVLSHHLWQTRFGSDPAIVGRTISVNGNVQTVVGVMPPTFTFPGLRVELFVAQQIDPKTAPIEGRNYSTVARLRDGVTLEAARADMASIAAQIVRERPANTKWGTLVVPLLEQATGDVRSVLAILFGAVVCVLLIACVNIANLLSMRSTARAREISVRLALGAAGGRIVQQLLIESLLLATLGGLIGLAIAYAGVPAILAMIPPTFPLPRMNEITVDTRVLAFTFGVSIVAGLLFGLVPVLQARRRSLMDPLRASGRSVAGGGARMRASLVVVEVMLAVVLVIGAGLMVRSLVRLSRVDPGFRTDRVLTMRMLLLVSKYGYDVPRRAAVVEDILSRVRALPEISSASTIHFLPLRGNSGTGYWRDDRPAPRPGEGTGGGTSVVAPGYFRTMGIPFVKGRDFDSTRDRMDGPRAVIINEAMAAQFFPGEDPIGKRLHVQWNVTLRKTELLFEIVGIVKNIRHDGLAQPARPCIFLSQDQEPSLFVSLVVRTMGNPLNVATAVRRQIRDVDPDQGVSDVETMEMVVAESMARPRVQTMLLGAFGALALVMACIGLYGVLSYSVEQRRREMGVRLALGAAPASILRLIVGEGVRLTTTGLAIGLIAAFAATRYLATLLYDVQPHDAAVFTAVAASLLVVSMMACWIPARRATRVDPASILRDE